MSKFKLMDMTWSLKKDVDDGETCLHIEFQVEETEYDFTHAEAKELHENLGSLLEKWPHCDTCIDKDAICEPCLGIEKCVNHKLGDK